MSYIFKTKNFSLNLNRTYVMGILNVTPDSFSDAGKFFDIEKAVAHAVEMKNQGADIIDIGGQSTRPGYSKISALTEWDRVKDVIHSVRRAVNIPISIDTFYPFVAKKAIETGVDVINDVSGFENIEMFEIAKETSCGCVIMSNVSLLETPNFFSKVLKNIEIYHLNKESICFDPGIGFGKSHEENLEILRHTKQYCPEGYPILVGASKKRVVAIPALNPPIEERLPCTIAAHTLSIASGANIIRVHQVKEAKQATRVTDAVLKHKKI